MTDYKKLDYHYRQHYSRFERYVKQNGLTCSECGGAGGEVIVVLFDEGSGPFEYCGWCEGTGKMTRHMRGLWLKFKREEAREKRLAKSR